MNKKVMAFLLAWTITLGNSAIKANNDNFPPLTSIQKKQIDEFYQRIGKLITVNLNYCEKQDEGFRMDYSSFLDRIEKVAKVYNFSYSKSEKMQEKPTMIECYDVLHAVENVHNDYIKVLEHIYWAYKKLPPLSDEDRKHFGEFLRKLYALNVFDCIEDGYQKSSDRYYEINGSPITDYFGTIIDLYELHYIMTIQEQSQPTSEMECLKEMDKRESIYKQYTHLIERLYKNIPPAMIEKHYKN